MRERSGSAARMAGGRALATGVALIAASGYVLAQPATSEYVVKPGDTCLGIAVRELGDRSAYAAIHRANPGLGPLPHVLRAGQVLRLPPRRAAPDAVLTGTLGEVRVQRPGEHTWQTVIAGAELFPAWRVATSERASAVVTYRAPRQLFLREATTLVVAGGEVRLESGGMRTHLSSARGDGLRVETAGGVATLGAGSAVITREGPATRVANHGGKAIELRGTRGARVSVTAGMGSRVIKGGAPEAPHRLLAAPAWRDDVPTAFAAVGPGRATVTAAWSPVDGAAGYRLELDGPGGASVLAAELPPSTTLVELHEAVPGTYTARVAAVDGAGLEGPPAPGREVRVVAVAVGAPGRESELPDGVPPGPMPPPGRGAPAAPAIVAQGGALGDETLACEGGGRSGAPLVVTTTGPLTIRCTTVDGVAVAPFPVEIAAVTAVARGHERGIALVRGAHEEVAIDLTSDVPLGDRWRVEPGPGLTCEGYHAIDGGVTIRVAVDGRAPGTTTLDVIDDRTGGRVALIPVAVGDPPQARIDQPAPPPPPPRAVAPTGAPPRISAGVFVGWTAFPTGATEGLELGDPPVSAYQVDSGAGGGMRAAWWPRADLFVEVDAGLWPTGFVDAAEPAWIVSGHAVLGHRFARGERLGARAVIGAGGYALLGDAAFASADIDPDVTWGLTGTWRLRPDLVLRLDGRHRIAPDRAPAGVTDVFELSVGLELPVIGTTAR